MAETKAYHVIVGEDRWLYSLPDYVPGEEITIITHVPTGITTLLLDTWDADHKEILSSRRIEGKKTAIFGPDPL